MKRKSVPVMEFDENEFLIKVKECGNAMARGDFSKGRLDTIEESPKEMMQSDVSHVQQENIKFDYESKFLIVRPRNKKHKRISIDGEYHAIMDRFLSQMGENRVSINNYFNNIIEAHFNQYSYNIEALYQEKQQKKLF